MLDNVCLEDEDASLQTPVLIKEGQLKKYKSAGKLSNSQWKKYNFSLFNDSIHYSRKYDSQVFEQNCYKFSRVKSNVVLIVQFKFL